MNDMKTFMFMALVLISQILGKGIYQQPSENAVHSTTDERIFKKSTPQIIYRLKNGTIFSGVVQAYVEEEWRELCPDGWNLNDANMLCKELGFQRGALTLNSTFLVSHASFGLGRGTALKLRCDGDEHTILDCPYKILECLGQSPATVTCNQNRYSYCNYDEEPNGDNCYRFVKENKTSDQAHTACNARGSELVVIESDREYIFLYDRLNNMNSSLSWHVGLVRRPTNYKTTMFSARRSLREIERNNSSDAIETLKKQNRCSIMQYPMLAEEIEFWPVSTSRSHCAKAYPFICKHMYYNIGCIESMGETYVGKANVTRSGLPCLPWNTPNLPIDVSQEIFDKILRGHNYCRNPNADDAPWCYYSPSKHDYCDIPQCKTDLQDAIPQGIVGSCPENQYRCTSGMCIPESWVCDGERDCVNGDDESACSDPLSEFEKTPNVTINEDNVHVIKAVSLITCAKRCLEKENNTCKEFAYNPSRSRCLFNNGNRNYALLKYAQNYDHYKRIIPAEQPCVTGFRCTNGKCIPSNGRCNTTDDCGDGSDEHNCTSGTDFAIRLNGVGPRKGIIEVRVNGVWGLICATNWDLQDAKVACRQLHFSCGAAGVFEFVPPSYSASRTEIYLTTDVNCIGNETSLEQCGVPGWQPLACPSYAAAGVVCLLDNECDQREFTCQNGQLIPHTKECDGTEDCSDGSDENPERCTDEIPVRLADGPNSMSGRVEIRYRGVWGTICNDNWDQADAQVICRSLGFLGEATTDDGRLPGTGPIFLDSVFCVGVEQSLAQCNKSEWNTHDCTHSEDATVVCANVRNTTALEIAAERLLPQNCGTRAYSDVFNNPVKRHAKIAGGIIATHGAYPWHAAIFRKQSDNSIRRWCGASIISEFFLITATHCLVDNASPSSYLIRVGDTDQNIKEQDEKDFEVQKIILHSQYHAGQRYNNDIALMQIKPKYLGTGFQFGEYVRPICLPSPTTVYTPGTECFISGWGDTNTGSSVPIMRVAMVPLLPRSTCSSTPVYGPGRLTAGMFCAGYLEGGIDTCKGDSGGPLACKMNNDRFALFGVTSWGAGCANRNKPGVYATVVHYLPWIYEHLNVSSPGIENSHTYK